MKKTKKAVLLSALVFPGLGHIYLKKYISGTVLAIVSFGGLYFLISKILERAYQVLEKIQNGEVSQDIVSIWAIVSKPSNGTETQILHNSTLIILICWIVAIVDSYRVGVIEDKKENISDEK